MKLLELTNFSAGICGVWARVRQEAIEFSKLGHQVYVFSSNAVKGSNELAKCEDSLIGIKIRRFPFKKLGGESFMRWNFEKEAVQFAPDVIIAHSYRHLHTTKALKIAQKLRKSGKKCKVFLVTHAPFVEGRKFPYNLIVKVLDFFNRLNEFDKIIAITKWEIPALLRLGAKREKIAYIPNGLPKEFFTQKKAKADKDVLFLGRISPVKSLETLILAAKQLPSISFSIVGSAEKDYLEKLRLMIKKDDIRNIKFLPPVYDLRKKIKLIDSYKIFVLPSKSEAMPQVLLEAMSRGKVVISSKTKGGKEIIKDKKTGFLFERGDFQQLAGLINANIKGNKKMQSNALNDSKKYAWSKLIKSYIGLFEK